ncbi:APC family permease [Streptomyces sp. URMC 129]|uniref:APC family permease n=1 Tax=Streptomyces sp. URMC 129 TaxID=3423407 RepID=UPI003F1ADADC
MTLRRAARGQDTEERGMGGNLGLFAVTLMVVATTAPLAVVAGVTPLGIALGNGAGVAGTFLVVAAVMLLFSVALSALSPHVRSSGAFYSYVGRGLGPLPGAATAGVSWATYTAILLAVYAYLGVQCSASVVLLNGPELDWWVYSLLGLAVIAVLGYHRIDLSARTLAVALALEIGIITVVDLAVLFQGGADGIRATGLTPDSVFPSGSAFTVAAMFCAIGFLGFEISPVFREEARAPDRTVPLATYCAIGFTGLFYAASAWLVSLAWPEDALAGASIEGAPFLLGAAESFVGTTAADLIQLFLTTSLFACALSLHNVLARYDNVLGRSRMLPAAVGRVHPRHGSPYTASLVTTLVTLAAFGIMIPAGLDPVTAILAWFNGIAALGFFTLLCLTCLSTLVFFTRTGTGGRPWRTRYVPAAGFLALLALIGVTLRHFSDLVGRSTAFSAALAAIIPLAGLLGLARALHLRTRHPTHYDAVRDLTVSR